jgi:hypothetical protein
MQHSKLQFPFTIRSSNLFLSITFSNQNCVFLFSIPYHRCEMPRACYPHFLSTELVAINNISTLRYSLQPVFYIFLFLTDLQVSGKPVRNYKTWKYSPCWLHDQELIIAMYISHWLKVSRLLYILIGQLLKWRWSCNARHWLYQAPLGHALQMLAGFMKSARLMSTQ